VYIDDFLLLAPNEETCRWHTEVLLWILHTAGFPVNWKKSELVPARTIEYLGFRLDFRAGLILIPPSKLKAVIKATKQLWTLRLLTPRKGAAILGRIRACLVAFPQLKLLTEALHRHVLLHRQFGCPAFQQFAHFRQFQQVPTRERFDPHASAG